MAAFTAAAGGRELTLDEGLALLAPHAREALVEVARDYHRVITYGDLATRLEQLSGLRPSLLLQNWIGKLLSRLVHEGHGRGEPPLTALVVHSQDGRVGHGYDEVLALYDGAATRPAADPELHAAHARLECYRYFGAAIPDSGGRPALAPRLAAALARQQPPRAARVCSGCFTEVSVAGGCLC